MVSILFGSNYIYAHAVDPVGIWVGEIAEEIIKSSLKYIEKFLTKLHVVPGNGETVSQLYFSAAVVSQKYYLGCVCEREFEKASCEEYNRHSSLIF